ncbi:MAG: zinc ribbon domain-containing protein [Treponemataceae bacterium]|nr:zinc ribbon domain-containing protein [Treponemataceae bacterium]
MFLLFSGCNSSGDEGGVAAEEETPVVEVPLVQEPVVEPEPFLCPFCGEAIPENSIYCFRCGKKIEDFGREEPWHSLSSLDELVGLWLAEDGARINYPDFSLQKDSRMLSFSWPEESVTLTWAQYAEENGLSLNDMWEKRNIYRAAIHGEILADENGSQLGFILRRDSLGDIYARRQLFVPEKIVRDNLLFFIVSPDGNAIRTNGLFRFFSSICFTLEGSESVYKKGVEQ